MARMLQALRRGSALCRLVRPNEAFALCVGQGGNGALLGTRCSGVLHVPSQRPQGEDAQGGWGAGLQREAE